ncbi:heat-shock protein, partial [Trifolium medium]|nr:heat-shock protein [Trifolium medium]
MSVSDLKSLPFTVSEGPDGYPLIHARYLGEVKTFTPMQVFAMMLSNMKEITTKNLNAAVHDCCIAIPVYFTDLQRRAVLDAATIAGLHPLRLLHETTATALAYGIYKTDLPENDPLIVAFVDIRHASMQVLFHHLAGKFKEEYKIHVHQNARACLRLRAACEKMKKMLSANPVMPLNIECLMDETDVKGIMKRE